MGPNYCADPRTPEADEFRWDADAVRAVSDILFLAGRYVLNESRRIARESGVRTEAGEIHITTYEMKTAYRNLLRTAMEDPSQFY